MDYNDEIIVSEENIKNIILQTIKDEKILKLMGGGNEICRCKGASESDSKEILLEDPDLSLLYKSLSDNGEILILKPVK